MRPLLPACLALTMSIAGCKPATTSKPIGPASTLEVFEVVDADDVSADTLPDAVSGEMVRVAKVPLITTKDVHAVSLLRSDSLGPDGKPTGSHNTEMEIQLTATGSSKMATASGNMSGKNLAVVINDMVVARPSIRAPLSTLSTGFTFNGDDKAMESAFRVLTEQ